MSSDGERWEDKSRAGRVTTKWDAVLGFLTAYRRYIVGAMMLGGLAAAAGYISLPDLTLTNYLHAFALVSGLTIGSSAVLHEVEDHLTDRRVKVLIAPVSGDVTDVIRVPRKTFGQFEVVGPGTFPTRRLMTGGEVFVARAIDFDSMRIAPALDDEELPDDLTLIGEDGDGSYVQLLREKLLDGHRKWRQTINDNEVIKESAKAEGTNDIPEALEKGRAGEMDVESGQQDEGETSVETVIETLGNLGNDGGNGGGDDE